MKERKTSKGQIVAIIFLTLLLIADSAYLYYDKVYLKEQKKHTEEKKSSKNKKASEDVVRTLSLAEERLLLSQIDEYNAYLSLDYPIDDIKNYDNQKKLLFVYAMQSEKNKKEVMQGELKKMANSYFGKANGVVYEDIECFYQDGVLYSYDDSARVFHLTGEHDHDELLPYLSTSFYVDGTVKNETDYTITVHTIYHEYCGSTCGPNLNFYQNAMDAMNHTNAIITREEEKDLTESDYEKVKEKLEKVIYTFHKDESGNYGLVSVMF